MSKMASGKRLASLNEIIAELNAQRRIDLRYEIETYVRPAEIDYGHFHYSAAPGAPVDLSMKLRSWLETTTHVEWEVIQSEDAGAESAAEERRRKKRETLRSSGGPPAGRRGAEGVSGRTYPASSMSRKTKS